MSVRLIFLLFFSTTAALPNGTCSIANKACEVHEENFIQATIDVSLDECRQLCYAEPACAFLSYFGLFGLPFPNTCELFSSCDSLTECTECQTEDASCRICSGAVEGQLGANVLQVIPDMEQEVDCKEVCATTESCTFYTFHDSSTVFSPNTCFLQASFLEPIQQCSYCRYSAEESN